MDNAGFQFQLSILSPVASQQPDGMPVVDPCSVACRKAHTLFREFLARDAHVSADVGRSTEELPKLDTSTLVGLLQPSEWPELPATVELDAPMETLPFVNAKTAPKSVAEVTFQAEQQILTELPVPSQATNIQWADDAMTLQVDPSTIGRDVSLNQKPVEVNVESPTGIAPDQLKRVDLQKIHGDWKIKTDSPLDMARPGDIKTAHTYQSTRLFAPSAESWQRDSATKAQIQPSHRPLNPSLAMSQQNDATEAYANQAARLLARSAHAWQLDSRSRPHTHQEVRPFMPSGELVSAAEYLSRSEGLPRGRFMPSGELVSAAGYLSRSEGLPRGRFMPSGELVSAAGVPTERLVELGVVFARNNGIAHEPLNTHSLALDQTPTSLPAIEPRSTSTAFDASVPVSPATRPTFEKTLVHQVAEAMLPHNLVIQKGTPHEICVHLYPEELGQLQIVVGGEPDYLRARIIASELATAELLMREKLHLVTALKEQGIDLPDVDISHRDAHDRQPPNFTHAPASAKTSQPSFVEIPHQVDTSIPRLSRRNSLSVDLVA